MITSRVNLLIKALGIRNVHICRQLKSSENPVTRTFNLIKKDVKKASSVFSKNDNFNEEMFPSHCDVAIIGGGAMGSSIAYWLKERTGKGLSVAVIEKDPTVSNV